MKRDKGGGDEGGRGGRGEEPCVQGMGRLGGGQAEGSEKRVGPEAEPTREFEEGGWGT
jgi:hypothetical protein